MDYSILKNKITELDVRSTKHSLPISDEYLQKLEAVISAKLPESYRWFLKTYSKCWIPMASSCEKDQKQLGLIEGFHGNSSRSAYDDLIYFYDDFVPNQGISPEFLPIGDDPGGNQTLLAIKGENCGKIYFWDHETGETLLVADSFEDFILCLRTNNY